MVVEMGAAAASGGMFGKALVATWANKTVAQAVKICVSGLIGRV